VPDSADHARRFSPSTRERIGWIRYHAGLWIAGGVALALVTFGCFQLGLNSPTTAFIFLIIVVFFALLDSFVSSVIFSVIAVGCLDYFFVEPLFSLHVSSPQDIVTLIAFTLTSLAITSLVRRVNRLSELHLDQTRQLELTRATEQRNQDVERQLRSTLDTIPVIVWTAEADGGNNFHNEHLLSYTGLSPQKLQGDGWTEMFHPDDAPRHMARWRDALAAGTAFEFESRLRRFDGAYRWFLARAVPLRDEAGTILKWYGTNVDIDDLKKSEKALRRSEAYLAEAQRLSHTGSFGWNVETGEIVWSDETFRIFGYDRSVVPTIAAVMRRVHPEDMDFVGTTIEQMRHSEACDCEHRLLLPDGSVKYLRVVAHAAKDPEGGSQMIGAVMDITAAKLAEQELRYNEQRSRYLFQHSPVALFQISQVRLRELVRGVGADSLAEFRTHLDDPEFLRRVMEASVVEDVNLKAVEMFGARGPEDLLGPTVTVWRKDPAALRRALESRFLNQPTFQDQMKIETLDGRDIDVLVTVGRPDLSANRNLTFLAFFDITDRVRTLEGVRQSEQRYRHLFEHMPVALWSVHNEEVFRRLDDLRGRGVTDLAAYLDEHPDFSVETLRNTRVSGVNQHAVQIYGSRDPAQATVTLGQIWRESPGTYRRLLEARFRGENEFEEDTKLTAFDGQVRHGRFFVMPYPVAFDAPGMMLAGFHDETDRIRAQEALAFNEQRYRQLFEYSPVALAQVNALNRIDLLQQLRDQGVTDLSAHLRQNPALLGPIMDSSVVERVNQRMVEMFGARDAGELLGTTALLWKRSPETFMRGLESRYRGEEIFQEEMELDTLDGRVLNVLVTVARPQAIGALGINFIGLVDTTQRVRAQEMLQQVQAEFARAARVSMLGEIAASIAHEVNQPLAAMMTNGEAGLRWLNRDEPNLQKARDIMERVVHDASRAADIISRVRAMAAGRAPNFSDQSVHEIIIEAIEFLGHEIRSKGVDVSLDLDRTLPKVSGDRVQLQQVVVNLVINAIQAMAASGARRHRLRIAVSQSDDGGICCVFEDSGPGIDPQHLDRLFDSFFTTKDSGMGMGLPVSRSIIEAHGGTIRADSESSLGGARFLFILPTDDSVLH